MKCRHCEVEFNPDEKRRLAKRWGRPVGLIDECVDCTEEDVVRKTGTMIHTGEGESHIQINTDPRLTKFLNTRRWESTGNTRRFDTNKPLKHRKLGT